MNRSDELEPPFNAELDKLKEFIETRKASLEEEIEETLHQAIADAKDSLELVQENIEPKVEKIIQTKMEYIDNKMENWKKDFRNAAREEVKVGSEGLAQKTLEGLNAIIKEKEKALKEELLPVIREEIKNFVEPSLKKTTEDIQRVQGQILIVIGLATFVLACILILQFFR